MSRDAPTDIRDQISLETFVFTGLRIVIGWHFLYEGLTKVLDPEWSAGGYLARSGWIFSDWFRWIAGEPTVLERVDLLNQWGLVLVGLGLMLGVGVRIAAAGGVALLGLYYAANPPFLSPGTGEGSYLFVDKNVVELVALLAVAVSPRAWHLGLGGLVEAWRERRRRASEESARAWAETPTGLPVAVGELSRRRAVLKALIPLPFLGSFAYAFLRRHPVSSLEEKAFVDGVTSATVKSFSWTRLQALQGRVPRTRIGDLELSRLILGGNLMGGWAHARDLVYVSTLVKAYHREGKVFETLHLAEECGINTILTNPILADVINRYWSRGIGKIQFISDCALKGRFFDGVKMSIDKGAHACYVQGGIADRFVEEGKIGEIARALEIIRDARLPAGIGAHRLSTVQACVDAGILPDFWMKTLHTTDYWSAKPEEEHNNIWCRDPDETIATMNDRPEPWIAFKVLAAGALDPERAFRHALEGGADLLCVGMYDFQIVDDVNTFLAAYGGPFDRPRPWRA